MAFKLNAIPIWELNCGDVTMLIILEWVGTFLCRFNDVKSFLVGH